MINIEGLRKISCEDGLYAVCVENGGLVSHYRIMCLRKNGTMLINFTDARVTDGFILCEGEFVTSLQVLKEIGIKADFSALSGEWTHLQSCVGLNSRWVIPCHRKKPMARNAKYYNPDNSPVPAYTHGRYSHAFKSE